MSASDHEAPGRDAPPRSRLTGAPPASMGPPAGDMGRDVANEDFLFHLYRGSELLQDNRVLEAKSELEHALTLQPRDPKGQDLLAVVYFRIGLYPHAIQIYEELLRENPRDHSLRLNLALCYLKTGQAQVAREQLEAVVQNNPAHKRAWGYLGLAFERLGDLEKAVHAFERGSHTQMAKRLLDRGARGATAAEGTATPETVAVRAAAKAAFEELDAGELSFSLAAQDHPTTESGHWTATEPGTASPRASAVPPQAFLHSSIPPARKKQDTLDFGVDGVGVDTPVRTQRGIGSPRPIGDVTRDARFVFPQEGVTILDSGLALVRTRETPSERSFAARLEAIRAYSGDLTTDVMQRQTRGQVANETFGGVGTPIVSVSGAGHLVLGPRHAHRLCSFFLRDEVAFVREENLLGFDLTLSYESGRLAVGEGDTAVMVQLRGAGAALIELLDPLATLEVTSGRGVTVRREALVGWVGRLVPRALSISEAPCGQRGLVGFSGDGSILVAAR
jgi:uncharacterized protein (AIM24 family)/thioredoxin-like negative regulator of GroEL